MFKSAVGKCHLRYKHFKAEAHRLHTAGSEFAKVLGQLAAGVLHRCMSSTVYMYGQKMNDEFGLCTCLDTILHV